MVKLYSNIDSGNSYKVRLLASLISEPLDIVELSLSKNEQHDPSFLAINPKGEVPTLVDGPHTITDSSAILVYIAGKHPDSKYWSTDIAEQAAIIDWLAFANSWVQFGVFTARAVLCFGGQFNGLGSSVSPTAYEEGVKRGKKSLEILDEWLRGREWLALDRPTIADIAVFPYIALAPMGDISLQPYQNVLKWTARIKALKGFIPATGMDDPMYYRRK
ncbi:glutathione S-transferase [Cadophora sp. DSE1049]|nr:glutathione S-transferase [Cadophora sp. DSE1049]